MRVGGRLKEVCRWEVEGGKYERGRLSWKIEVRG